jgi:hypothetical protein
MRLLRVLVDQLGSKPDALAQLLAALQADASVPVSTFELLSSGVVKHLLTYLRPHVKPDGGADSEVVSKLSSFAAVALPPGSGRSPPMLALTRRLQAALTATDSFSVLTSPSLPVDAMARSGPAASYYYARYGSAPPQFQGNAGSISSGLSVSLLLLYLGLLPGPITWVYYLGLSPGPIT